MNIMFGPIAPKKFILKPNATKSDTEVAMVLDNLCDALMHTRIERGDMSQAEFAAAVMDEYFSTPHGTPDMYALQDISYKLNNSFTNAYDILVNKITPEIGMISKRIDEHAAMIMDRKLGHQDNQGNYTSAAPRFKLLDVGQLYKAYNASAKDCALHLCKKYNFHVEYINDTNINALLSKIEPTADIEISKETFQALFGDAVVTVTVDGGDEIVIDTSEPENVKADDNVSQTESTGDPVDNGGDPDNDGGSANVTVSTNDNADVTINVNGETVTTDPEETELLKLMLSACFSTNAFNQLRTKLFANQGYVTGDCLTSSLFFLANQLNKIIEKIGGKHLSPVTLQMVRENLGRIHELQMGALIFLDVQSIQFSDKIIISKNLLNKNQVNKMLSEGIDIYPLLRDHIRVYHNTNEDDLYYSKMQHLSIGGGVSYDQVMVDRYQVEQKLIHAKEETKKDFANLLTNARVQAFHNVVGAYIQEVATRATAEQLNVNENDETAFINRNLIRLRQYEDLLRQSDNSNNIEDLLYNFYFSNWYGGTTVERIYQYTSEYLRQSMTTASLNPDTIKFAKMQTIAELGSRTLFDAFIKE